MRAQVSVPHGKIEEVDELKLNSFTGPEATMSTITSSSSEHGKPTCLICVLIFIAYTLCLC